ncbi:MAG: ABC transporter permease [Sulfolobales archaeon]|jgi:peptide/nickel transport system permease protein
MGLSKYFVRRALFAIPLIIVIITINFILVHLAPGDPIAYIVGTEYVSPEYIERLRAEYGLDRPLWEQYWIYMAKVLSFDLGYSYRYREPVINVIIERLPATLILMLTAITWATLAGIAIGVRAALNPGGGMDRLATTLATISVSIPTFWLGLLLIIFLGGSLKIFPTQGMVSPSNIGYKELSQELILDIMWHLVLPSITLGTAYLGIYIRTVRSLLVDELGKDYVLLAIAKGLRNSYIVWRYAFRAASPSIMAIIGLNIGTMLAGATLTETVFAWPGMGRLIYESAIARDYPVILGIFIFVSISVIVANLVVDMINAILDPRIRY